MKGRRGHRICTTDVQQSINVVTAGFKPTSFSFSPECLLLSFILSTLTNDNNEIRKSLLAVFHHFRAHGRGSSHGNDTVERSLTYGPI